MRSRISVLLSLALIAAITLGCVPPSEEEAQQLSTAFTAAERTVTAAASRSPTDPPATDNPPTATPRRTEITVTDPSGDLVQCQTGEPMADGASFIDVGKIHVDANESGVSFTIEFPQTDDLAAEFGGPGSFLGILMLDNGAEPQPPDPQLGTYGLGLLRVDAIWTGQSLDKRVYARSEAGTLTEQDNNVEVAAEGNHLRIKLTPSRWVTGIDRAGFAVLSINACDLVGAEFNYDSGRPTNGLLALDIDLDLDF